MRSPTTQRLGYVPLLATVLAPGTALVHDDGTGERLATIGLAPDFTLTTQSDTRLSLADLH